jgi:hypothetical protein
MRLFGQSQKGISPKFIVTALLRINQQSSADREKLIMDV